MKNILGEEKDDPIGKGDLSGGIPIIVQVYKESAGDQKPAKAQTRDSTVSGAIKIDSSKT